MTIHPLPTDCLSSDYFPRLGATKDGVAKDSADSQHGEFSEGVSASALDPPPASIVEGQWKQVAGKLTARNTETPSAAANAGANVNVNAPPASIAGSVPALSDAADECSTDHVVPLSNRISTL